MIIAQCKSYLRIITLPYHNNNIIFSVYIQHGYILVCDGYFKRREKQRDGIARIFPIIDW